jgi:hypothetical protein
MGPPNESRPLIVDVRDIDVLHIDAHYPASRGSLQFGKRICNAFLSG